MAKLSLAILIDSPDRFEDCCRPFCQLLDRYMQNNSFS